MSNAKAWRRRRVKWLRDCGCELPRGEVGEIVDSTLNARWRGVIVEINVDGRAELVCVRVTHDRHGKPVRKPNRKHWLRRLDVLWLRKVQSDQ